jgi:hypothetical protein
MNEPVDVEVVAKALGDKRFYGGFAGLHGDAVKNELRDDARAAIEAIGLKVKV